MRVPEAMFPQLSRLAASLHFNCARSHHKRIPSALVLLWILLLATMLCLPHAAFALNNCLDANFQDRRGQAEILIINDNPENPFVYRPRCVTISEGTRVRFAAVPDFGMHPLYGGLVSGGLATIDPTSPIGSFTSGVEGERILIDSGEFPYFCDFHFSSGMMGSIRVVPQLFADGFD